ncbi:10420_t:CDS:2 [Ambispora leptoticha]|uniref:10420_t:CDS:1 n=1 Tax=Ambispora leptoticha TaxID=144679 RepID=A0A9N9HDW7_9GLOM|nr:10420_t:CDS:2 [Ambispora leptoticha]
MSGINPSKDHFKQEHSSTAGFAGGPTFSAHDKYDNARHLNYGQTENQKKSVAEEETKNETSPTHRIRRYSASGDSAPRATHTFMDEILGGKTGDDLIEKKEHLERDRQNHHRKEQHHDKLEH